MFLTENKAPIYVVDDDEDDQLFMQQCFNSQFPANRFNFFDSGLQFLDALETGQTLPAIVLLDLNMPMMSGFEILYTIRLNPKYDTLPIVILTTSSQEEDRKKAHELKANKFITKPRNIKDICRTLMELCIDYL